MHVELWVLGICLVDFTVGPAAAAEEPGVRGLEGSFLGFTAAHAVPEDVPGVDRNNGWGDEDSGR